MGRARDGNLGNIHVERELHAKVVVRNIFANTVTSPQVGAGGVAVGNPRCRSERSVVHLVQESSSAACRSSSSILS